MSRRWLVTVAIAMLAGCFASRRSIDFECRNQADCADHRTCVQGYCVLDPGTTDCPSACSSCDTRQMTCTITCDNASDCATGVACPPGYDCTFHCSAPDACRAIDCSAGTACEIHCDNVDACTSAIVCGPGRCDVHCNAANACPVIDCTNSCACDVSCNQSDLACGQEDCPTRGGRMCTSDGGLGANCSSTAVPACSRCP